MKARILVVDDEGNIARTLTEILEDEGYTVASAGTGEEAMKLVCKDAPDLILLDVMLPDTSGLELLKKMRSIAPGTEVIMISGHATVDRAFEASKAGAYEFLEKPLSMQRVLLTVARALERRQLTLECDALQTAEQEQHRIVGESDGIGEVLAQVEKVAPTNARVLVTGETGTGKELVAYWLHHLSPRKQNPFVQINCAAIPKDLLESEFFGHEKGAFTGAASRKQGKFEAAHTGTLLLDEIGDMDPRLQAKLLRVLESGEFEPLGSNRMIKADIRIVAATNKDLAHEIREGNFREDLYHRLNVFSIHIPALRERPDDIPVLANHFLERFCQQGGLSPKRFREDALDHLAKQPLPGNVRELKNLVERAAIVGRGYEITATDLRGGAALAGPDQNDLFTRTRPLSEARNELERAFLEAQLTRFGWNITSAAKELSVERSNLSRRLKQLGITKPEPYS